MKYQASEGWQLLRRLALLLTIGAFCLFLPTLFHSFFADDDIYLSFGNRVLRETRVSELHLFLLGQVNPWEYLPVRDLTYWLDFQLFEVEGAGFHASNLLWYGLSALGVVWLFRQLILLFRPEWASRALALAACGAALFVVHPSHVEAVAWVASRKDLVAGALGFFSMALLVHAIRSGWSYKIIFAAAALLLAACFGKSAGMTSAIFQTVLIMAAWRLSPEVPSVRKIAAVALLWGVVVFAAWVHMKTADVTGIRIENQPGTLAVLDRASRILSMLVGLLLAPYPLGLYHDVYRAGEWHWLVSGVVVLLVAFSIGVTLFRRALWPLGVILAVAPCVVYLQIIPFTTWSLASERFIFVSVAGLSLVLIDIFGAIDHPKKISVLLLLVWLPCAILAWERVAEWASPNELRALEYERQPEFHNAVRDQVIYVLLPQKRYIDAEELAASIKASYAADALRANIRVERAYEDWRMGCSAGRSEDCGQREYCRAIAELEDALARGYLTIRHENDLSYNNLLRSLERQMEFRYTDLRQGCKRRV